MVNFYRQYKSFCRVFITLSLISILAKWSYTAPSSLFIDELMLLFQAEFHFERLLNFIFKFSYHPIIYYLVLKIFTFSGETILYIKLFSYLCHIIISVLISSFGRNKFEKIALFLVVITNVYLNAYSLVISSYIFSITLLSLFLYYYVSEKEYPRLEILLFTLNLYTNYMTGSFIFLILISKYCRLGFKKHKGYFTSLFILTLPLLYTSPLRGLFFDRYSKVGSSGVTIEKVTIDDPIAILLEILPFVMIFLLYVWRVARKNFEKLLVEDIVFFVFMLFLMSALIYLNQIYVRYFILFIPFLILRLYKLEMINPLLALSIFSFLILSPHQVSYYDNQKIDKLFEIEELKNSSEEKLFMISYNSIWYRYYFKKLNKNVFKINKKPLSITNGEVLNIISKGGFVFCIKYECPMSLLELKDNGRISVKEGKDFLFLSSSLEKKY